MRCEYQYFRIFDFGGFLDIEKARRALEGSFLVQGAAPAKGAPEYVSFAPALTLEFGERGLFHFENGAPCKVFAKIFELGAIAIHFSAKFEMSMIADLRAVWEFTLKREGKVLRKSEIAKEFFEEIRAKLDQSLIDRYDAEVPPEHYTVFEIECGDKAGMEFVAANRAALAALLINEKSPERLGAREVDEILGSPYSYYHDEMTFIDWDAAVMIRTDLREEDDILPILESANLQLLELRTYDTYLDRVIEKTAHDLRVIFSPGPKGLFKGRARRMVEELAETRVELEKIVDEINNVAKFYGDWYIGRVYLGCRKKLHVDRWLASVQEKLDTLRDLYELAATEATNRRLLVLEIFIVILFILDIVLLLAGNR